MEKINTRLFICFIFDISAPIVSEEYGTVHMICWKCYNESVILTSLLTCIPLPPSPPPYTPPPPQLFHPNQHLSLCFLKLLSPQLPLGCGCWVTGILAPTLTGNDLNSIQRFPMSTCKHIRALSKTNISEEHRKESERGEKRAIKSATVC